MGKQVLESGSLDEPALVAGRVNHRGRTASRTQADAVRRQDLAHTCQKDADLAEAARP